jgi:hypothetical protein
MLCDSYVLTQLQIDRPTYGLPFCIVWMFQGETEINGPYQFYSELLNRTCRR